MATTTTPQPSQAHPEHLESFGTHCSLPLCNVSDFLPFKCPYCALSFCGDHRLPDAHQCTSPLSASRERTATQCPLCGEVLPIVDLLALPPPPLSTAGEESGDNVDRAMELHLDSGRCRAMQMDSKGLLLSPEEQEVKKRTQGSNICAYSRCRNRMWIDLKCKECGRGFCPTHREGKAHRCTAAAAASGDGIGSSGAEKGMPQTDLRASASSTAAAKASRRDGSDTAGGKTGGLFGKLKNSTNTTATVQKTSINRSQPATSTSGTTSPSSSSRQPPSAAPRGPTKLSTQAKPESQSPSGGGNVLSQTLIGQPGILGKLNQTNEERTISKRAAAEQQAALLSLRNRAEKGLLNDDGKIRLATLEAELGKKTGRLPSSMKMGNTSAGGPAKKGDKKDCCIS